MNSGERVQEVIIYSDRMETRLFLMLGVFVGNSLGPVGDVLAGTCSRAPVHTERAEVHPTFTHTCFVLNGKGSR